MKLDWSKRQVFTEWRGLAASVERKKISKCSGIDNYE
jgi:hypothetical protein